MLVEILQYISGILMLIGAIFALLAAVGILRLPDLYTRMHSASKAGTMGSGLMLAAIAVVALDSSVTIRAILGFFFLVLTTPVSAHLLARAAYGAGYRPASITLLDEMTVHN